MVSAHNNSTEATFDLDDACFEDYSLNDDCEYLISQDFPTNDYNDMNENFNDEMDNSSDSYISDFNDLSNYTTISSDENEKSDSKPLLGYSINLSKSDDVNFTIKFDTICPRTRSRCLAYVEIRDNEGNELWGDLNITVGSSKYSHYYRKNSDHLYYFYLPYQEGLYECTFIFDGSRYHAEKTYRINVNNSLVRNVTIDVKNITLKRGEIKHIEFYAHDEYGNPIDYLPCNISYMSRPQVIINGTLSFDFFYLERGYRIPVNITNYGYTSGNYYDYPYYSYNGYLSNVHTFYITLIESERYTTDNSTMDIYIEKTINNNTMNLSVFFYSDSLLFPGNITVDLFNKSYKAYNKTNCTFSYTLPEEGEIHQAIVRYSGPYNVSYERTISLTLPHRKQTFIEMDSLFYLKLGSRMPLNFTIKDENGRIVEGVEDPYSHNYFYSIDVKTFYDSPSSWYMLAKNSSLKLDSPKSIGTYHCFIHYKSDKYTYKDSYAYFDIIVHNDVNMSLSFKNTSYGENIEFKGYLTSEYNGLMDDYIYIQILNKSSKFDKTYSFKTYGYNSGISIPSLNVGTYDVFAVYKGSNNYSSVNKSYQLRVSRAHTNIYCSDMNTYTVDLKRDGRIGDYLSVQLVDQFDKPLANKKVKIGFNGKVYNKTTNSTGSTKLQINLGKVGVYTFAICFLSDDSYYASFKVIKINVKKRPIPTKVSANSASSTVGKKIKLTATVKDKYGNLVKKGSVSFIVDGRTYTAKVSKGKASVNIPCPSASLYKRTETKVGDKTKITSYYKTTHYCDAVYNGYSIYLKNSSSFKITSSSVEVTYKSNVPKDSLSTFYINGKYYDGGKTLSNGDEMLVYHSTQNGQYGKGLTVLIYHNYPWVGPYYNKISKVVVYYKNSKGNLVSSTKTLGYYGESASFGLKSGYSIYKVNVYHRKLTSSESSYYKSVTD